MSARTPKRHGSDRPGDSDHFVAHVPGVAYDVLDDLVGYAIRRAQISLYEDFAVAVANEWLTPQRFAALVIIGANPGLRQTTLGQVLGIARSGVVATLDALASHDLLRREAVPGDRRAYSLWLTEAGVAELDRMKQIVRAHDQRIAAQLSPQERDTLVALLAKLG